jgi:hypothetical protein
LPIMTSGCRAVFDRRGGMSIVSGSSADRGLRGARRLLSLGVASMDATPTPLVGCAKRGGFDPLAPEAAASREYDTGGGIGEGLVPAARGRFARGGASPGARRFVGGLDSVTPCYPLFRIA